jgi:ParB-like chromosome segregation protein Spo0J
MDDLHIEYLPISAIKPYEKNARKHKDADVDAIVASIKEFGFDDPIGVWGDKNIIVEGHGRLMAAKKLGMESVPVIHLDHLTDEQRRAYALAHNKTAENSEWDDDLLFGELGEIFDIDMTAFGFSSDEELPLDDLDAEESEDDKIVARLVFTSYKDYARHEVEIKDFAESIGASVTVGK